MVDPIDMRDFGRLEANVEAQGREIGELRNTIDKYDASWRGRVARWVAAHLLDAFDPDGKHI